MNVLAKCVKTGYGLRKLRSPWFIPLECDPGHSCFQTYTCLPAWFGFSEKGCKSHCQRVIKKLFFAPGISMVTWVTILLSFEGVLMMCCSSKHCKPQQCSLPVVASYQELPMPHILWSLGFIITNYPHKKHILLRSFMYRMF